MTKAKTDLKQMRWWLQLSIFIFLAALLLVGAFIFDDSVRGWVSAHQSAGVKIFMRNVSRFGDWPEHVALGFVLLGAAWRCRSKKWIRIFLSMLIACAVAGMAARVIKIATGRARPSVRTAETWAGPTLSSKYHAFPSGHTASSTAFFAVLVFTSWRIGLAILPIPLLIGFSRMYVAAHYLSDVTAAALLGVICAALTVRAILPRSQESAD
jgi:membrane-associated phospholipid phosphatase